MGKMDDSTRALKCTHTVHQSHKKTLVQGEAQEQLCGKDETKQKGRKLAPAQPTHTREKSARSQKKKRMGKTKRESGMGRLREESRQKRCRKSTKRKGWVGGSNSKHFGFTGVACSAHCPARRGQKLRQRQEEQEMEKEKGCTRTEQEKRRHKEKSANKKEARVHTYTYIYFFYT